MDMMMDMGMGQEMNTSMRVSPTLIAVNQILALSSMELQNLIQEEIEQNPALELSEKATCTVCGELLRNGFCISCKRYTQSTSEQHDNSVSDFSGYREYDDYSMGSGSGSSGSDDDEFDPMTLVAAEANVVERLYYDLRATLPTEDLSIAEYLLGSLDDKGFLSASVNEVARALEVTVKQVERVLHQVQRLGPPGLGARDVRECLLLQIEYVTELGKRGEEGVIAVPPLARQIVDRFLTELGEHKYGFIAQKLGVSNDDVAKAREFIKEHLSPYPVMEGGEIQTWGSRSKAQYVQPDVRIREEEGKLTVEVIESQRFYLKLSPIYQKLTVDMKVQKQSFSDDDKKHIHQYVSRARLFMSNINQRRETMGKIARCLIECQENFIRHGVRVLKPLTRAQVAEITGLHESTVSRATAGKFVMLPSRQVIPFSDFFTASLSVKDVIKEIILKEAAQGKPLTDREIVARLKKEGIRVARRTVAKYRSQLGILPSTLR